MCDVVQRDAYGHTGLLVYGWQPAKSKLYAVRLKPHSATVLPVGKAVHQTEAAPMHDHAHTVR
jgi:hypothetical protein